MFHVFIHVFFVKKQKHKAVEYFLLLIIIAISSLLCRRKLPQILLLNVMNKENYFCLACSFCFDILMYNCYRIAKTVRITV